MKKAYTDSEIKSILKDKLPEKRYIHTLGVSETAAKMADIFGADKNKAHTAGLLHDCAKYMSREEQLEECKKLNVPLTNEDILCFPVIHAPLGGEIAKVQYGIKDEDVINAIKFHTVGRENMSDLEKIIYIADMVEPSRDFEGVKKLRDMAFKDLDKAMLECLKQGFIFNLQKNKSIHSNSLKCWNYLLNRN